MRALLSVSDKRGLTELGRGLADLGWGLTASGGTAAALRGAGLTVDAVAGGEWLDGRVKTLQAGVHAAILARRDRPQDVRDLEQLGVEPFDIVAVNLYPFRESPDVETIDIGGVALLRAAAKNWAFVAVLCDPDDYEGLLAELRAGGGLSAETRRALARKAFAHTAAYDASIAAWFGLDPLDLPADLTLTWRRVDGLRYGENPHQAAALYRDAAPVAPGGPARGPALVGAEVLQGKALSYNNWIDATAAWDLAGVFEETAAVGVKHAGPCGVALGTSPLEAYRRARDADPVSIFGGVVALNRPVDDALAAELARLFLEVVVASHYTEEARQRLAARRNLRLIAAPPAVPGGYRLRSVPGGVLVQAADRDDDPSSWRVVSRRPPEDDDWAELRFAWRVARFAASNAVVVSRDRATLGIGGGHPNRVGAARMALEPAGDRARGAVLASDGFFPFPDTVELAAAAGIRSVVAPGGSVRDAEVIATADRLGIALVFTETRHFRH